MKKILFTWVFLLTATAGFCALPILRTSFRGTDLEIVQDQARENNPGAQVELALRYYAGYQVDADAQKAFKWMSSAADLGDPEAMKLLSQMYAEGIGTKTDPAASEVWFARALGSVPDDVQLQEKYEASVAEKKENARELQEFLMLCADAGYAPAYAALKRPEAIELYSQENYQEALVIFQKLA
ncbi:MAG: tetratricopeptide repeat protein, partial [Kiritimatiellales bacterium]